MIEDISPIQNITLFDALIASKLPIKTLLKMRLLSKAHASVIDQTIFRRKDMEAQQCQLGLLESWCEEEQPQLQVPFRLLEKVFCTKTKDFRLQALVITYLFKCGYYQQSATLAEKLFSYATPKSNYLKDIDSYASREAIDDSYYEALKKVLLLFDKRVDLLTDDALDSLIYIYANYPSNPAIRKLTARVFKSALLIDLPAPDSHSEVFSLDKVNIPDSLLLDDYSKVLNQILMVIYNNTVIDYHRAAELIIAISEKLEPWYFRFYNNPYLSFIYSSLYALKYDFAKQYKKTFTSKFINIIINLLPFVKIAQKKQLVDIVCKLYELNLITINQLTTDYSQSTFFNILVKAANKSQLRRFLTLYKQNLLSNKEPYVFENRGVMYICFGDADRYLGLLSTETLTEADVDKRIASIFENDKVLKRLSAFSDVESTARHKLVFKYLYRCGLVNSVSPEDFLSFYSEALTHIERLMQFETDVDLVFTNVFLGNCALIDKVPEEQLLNLLSKLINQYRKVVIYVCYGMASTLVKEESSVDEVIRAALSSIPFELSQSEQSHCQLISRAMINGGLIDISAQLENGMGYFYSILIFIIRRLTLELVATASPALKAFIDLVERTMLFDDEEDTTPFLIKSEDSPIDVEKLKAYEVLKGEIQKLILDKENTTDDEELSSYFSGSPRFFKPITPDNTDEDEQFFAPYPAPATVDDEAFYTPLSSPAAS